jgi:TatD DNase family protein
VAQPDKKILPLHMLIDTHSHLYEESFLPDWNEVVERCIQADVKKILLPNVDSSTLAALELTVHKNPELFIPMMGLHPCSVKENYQEELTLIKEKLFAGKYIAVGEIGIDLYWDKTFIAQQEEAFITQVEWANQLALPVSIHSRESTSMIIDILSKKITCEKKGVFHCFTGTVEEAKKVINLGYYLGISGVVTFKNSHLPVLLKEIGTDKLVLETDSPYLAPTPHRGKRNESSYTNLVAVKLADIFGISLPEVAEITSANANNIFKLY